MVIKWRSRLIEIADTNRGFSGDILSCFNEWVKRAHGELTYQVTQLITGHGCFKGYTHRIGKTDNSRCSFCGGQVEDNGHVLVECREWRTEREKLELAYGGRMESSGALLRGMATDPSKWKAAIEFAGEVMNRKEVVERKEQAEARHDEVIRETRELLEELNGRTGRRTGRNSMRSSRT